MSKQHLTAEVLIDALRELPGHTPILIAVERQESQGFDVYSVNGSGLCDNVMPGQAFVLQSRTRKHEH